jgi:high-affinity iron transporter
MKGVFNFGPQMTVLEVFTYFAYLIPTMTLFLLPRRSHVEVAPAAQSTEPTAMAAATGQGS